MYKLSITDKKQQMWIFEPTVQKRKEQTMNVSERLKGFAMKQFYEYLDKDPDTNIPKLPCFHERYADR